MLLEMVLRSPEGSRGLNLPDMDSLYKNAKLVSATETL